MTVDPAVLAEFEAELQAVQAALTTAVEELGSPLGELVHAQLKHSAPPVRAALVLAASFDPNGEAIHRTRRILLASALEMLAVALYVHRLLVDASGRVQADGVELDKSLIGSTILAGDYCFSRAASMAAQTDNPQIVIVFAQALQTVSEGQLRSLFNPAQAPFDENRALLRAGADAALELAGLDAGQRTAYADAAREFARRLPHLPADGNPLVGALQHLEVARRSRWQAFVQWLMSQRTNGRVAPVVQPDIPHQH